MACAFLCAQGIAMSESVPTVPPLRHILDISLDITPSELLEKGEVTLTLTVRNASDYAATNLYITSVSGHYSESLGRLGAGETQTYTRTYTVSQEELDAGMLSFTMSHDDIVPDGDPVTYTLDALITRIEAAPQLEFTRQISSRSVSAGASVMLTYRVYNSGNVPLTQVRVRDTLGSFAGSVELLEPGQSKVFTSRVTVDRDVNSQPSASYYASGDSPIEISLDSAQISVIEPVLTTGLTLDRQSAADGDILNGVITIAATGSDYTGIVVTDDINNTIIADTLELNAGETITLTCSWPVRGNTDFRVRVEGTDAAGQRTTAVSGTATVALTGEFSRSELAIAANAQTPEINREGSARITIAITNSGNAAARDVVLSEDTLGIVRTFDFIPAGEPTVKSVLVDVTEDTEFAFSIEYLDGDGNVVRAQCAPVMIRITGDGDEPAAAIEDGSREAYEISDSSAFYWMLGAGSAALLVLIIILIVSHDRERRERKLRRKMGRQRRVQSRQGPRIQRKEQ